MSRRPSDDAAGPGRTVGGLNDLAPEPDSEGTPGTPALGRVVASDGGAVIHRAAGERGPLAAGDLIFPGDRVTTGDAPVLISRFADGGSIVVGWSSTVTLTAGEDSTVRLELMAGTAVILPPHGCNSAGGAITGADAVARIVAGGAIAAITEATGDDVPDLELAGPTPPGCPPADVEVASTTARARLSDPRLYARVDGATGEITLLPRDVWAEAPAFETLIAFAELAGGLAGFETAAGPGDPAPGADGFDVDHLPVSAGPGLFDSAAYPTLPASQPLNAAPAPDPPPARSDHTPDPLTTLRPPPLVIEREVPPTRIVTLDSSEWSELPATWQALMPNTVVAAPIPFRPTGFPFYRTGAEGFREAGDATGLQHLEFAPPFGDHAMLVVSTQDNPAGQPPGGLRGSVAGDVAAFLNVAGRPWQGVDGQPVAVADGSALKAAVSVPPTHAIVFDFLFDPVDPGSAGGVPLNDIAVVVVNGEPVAFADAASTPGAASGWRTAMVSSPEVITSLAFGLLNAEDSSGDPQLAIDNLRLEPLITAAQGERVTLEGADLQVIQVTTTASGSATAMALARPPVAADDAPAAPLGTNQVLTRIPNPAGSETLSFPSVLDNDAAAAPSWTVSVAASGAVPQAMTEEFSYRLRVSAVDGQPGGVGIWMPASRADGDYGGLIRLAGNGHYDFDPDGAFADLMPGETTATSISYTVTADSGGWDTATLTLTVTGDQGIADFESDSGTPWEAVGKAAVAASYGEPGGAGARHYETLDGSDRFLVLTANGARPENPLLVETPQRLIDPFLGLDTPGSNAAAVLAGLAHDPIGGSAVRFSRPLSPGDVLSFYFAFDSNDLPAAGGLGTGDLVQYNDLAAFVFDGDVFPLATGAGLDAPGTSLRPGASPVLYAAFTVPDDVREDSVFAFWVSDDEPAVNDSTLTPEASALLIDGIAVNTEVPDGYAIASTEPSGPLTIYAPTTPM